MRQQLLREVNMARTILPPADLMQAAPAQNAKVAAGPKRTSGATLPSGIPALLGRALPSRAEMRCGGATNTGGRPVEKLNAANDG